MNKKKKTGSPVFSTLLVILGMASIVATVGVVGVNPRQELVFENSILSTGANQSMAGNTVGSPPFEDNAPFRNSTPVGETGDISWEVIVLGRDTLSGKEVLVLEFYPSNINLWRTHHGGKAYWSVEERTVIALQDQVLVSGHVQERFVTRTEDTEKTFQGLPLEILEQGL